MTDVEACGLRRDLALQHQTAIVRSWSHAPLRPPPLQSVDLPPGWDTGAAVCIVAASVMPTPMPFSNPVNSW